MKTKKSEYILTVLGVLLFLGGLVLIKVVPEPQGIMVALPYICIGVGCGLLGRGISILVSKNMMEKYPEIQKQKLDIYSW